MASHKKAPDVESRLGVSENRLARPDQFLEESFANAQATVKQYVSDVVEETRRNPERALLWAVGAGYLLRLLPTTRILSGLLRVLFGFVKPAAFLYGMSKLWNQKSTLVERQ